MNGPQGASEVVALALSGNRRYLAVAESAASAPLLSVFDLRSLKRRRTFAGPSMHAAAVACQAAPFRSLVALAFSSDHRHLAAVSAGPDHVVLEWQWQKEQLTACGVLRSSISVPRSLSYCPADASVLLVSGEGGAALLAVDWDAAVIAVQQPAAGGARRGPRDGEKDAPELAALDVMSHAWLDGERCVLGTRQGHLLLLGRSGHVGPHVSVHDGGGAVTGEADAAAFHPAKSVHSLSAFGGDWQSAATAEWCSCTPPTPRRPSRCRWTSVTSCPTTRLPWCT